jgi:UDP-glucuronate 4-epimerase
VKVLVTGVYGFIGFSVAQRLLELGHEVIGIERITNSKSEKNARIKILHGKPGFSVYDLDLSDFEATKRLLMAINFHAVLHLAGQYSKPYTEETMLRFIDGNIRTWTHLMHIAHLKKIPRVVYATSTHVPLSGYPTNMYGATLMFREIASKTYNDMGINTVAIRYATTYGPYMRADSPPAQIMEKIYTKKEIDLESGAFGGSYSWVHIDDAVEITIRALFRKLPKEHIQITALANELPQNLETCVRLIESYSGIKAVTKGKYPELQIPKLPIEQITQLKEVFDYVPKVNIRDGMKSYVDWYLHEGKAAY